MGSNGPAGILYGTPSLRQTGTKLRGKKKRRPVGFTQKQTKSAEQMTNKVTKRLGVGRNRKKNFSVIGKDTNRDKVSKLLVQ